MKKLRLLCVVVGMVIISGCSMLPPPANAIQSPKLNVKKLGQSKEMIVQGYLPSGDKLSPIKKEAKSILEKDIDGDGKNEIIFSYKSTKPYNNVGIMVLKNVKNKWIKFLQKEDGGIDVDTIDYADINGDKKNEMLISFAIGASAGNEAEIYDVHGQKAKFLASVPYNKMDIGDMPDKYGKKDGKAELGLWTHDSGTVYFVDIKRYNGSKLVPAADVYPYYFRRVVQYYEKLIADYRVENKENLKAPYVYWHLADAYLKSEQYEKALETVGKAFELKKEEKFGAQDYPEDYKLNLIKSEAQKKVNKK